MDTLFNRLFPAQGVTTAIAIASRLSRLALLTSLTMGLAACGLPEDIRRLSIPVFPESTTDSAEALEALRLSDPTEDLPHRVSLGEIPAGTYRLKVIRTFIRAELNTGQVLEAGFKHEVATAGTPRQSDSTQGAFLGWSSTESLAQLPAMITLPLSITLAPSSPDSSPDSSPNPSEEKRLTFHDPRLYASLVLSNGTWRWNLGGPRSAGGVPLIEIIQSTPEKAPGIRQAENNGERIKLVTTLENDLLVMILHGSTPSILGREITFRLTFERNAFGGPHCLPSEPLPLHPSDPCKPMDPGKPVDRPVDKPAD